MAIISSSVMYFTLLVADCSNPTESGWEDDQLKMFTRSEGLDPIVDTLAAGEGPLAW